MKSIEDDEKCHRCTDHFCNQIHAGFFFVYSDRKNEHERERERTRERKNGNRMKERPRSSSIENRRRRKKSCFNLIALSSTKECERGKMQLYRPMVV